MRSSVGFKVPLSIERGYIVNPTHAKVHEPNLNLSEP